MFLPNPLVKLSIVQSLRDREVVCSASDRQGSNFESCVWRTVSSHSSHHPQEILLAEFSLYVHKSGLKPDSFIVLSSCPAVNQNSEVVGSNPGRGMLIIGVVQAYHSKDLDYAVLYMVLCTINNPGSNIIMVGHSSEFVPISVVILL